MFDEFDEFHDMLDDSIKNFDEDKEYDIQLKITGGEIGALIRMLQFVFEESLDGNADLSEEGLSLTRKLSNTIYTIFKIPEKIQNKVRSRIEDSIEKLKNANLN